MFTSLTTGDSSPELSEIGVSSQMDAWLLLRNLESNGERNRGLYVLKSRGMPHSNQIREFVMTDQGVELLDVYVGAAGLLTGSARVALEAKERAERAERRAQAERKSVEFEQRRRQLEAQIAIMRSQFELEEQAFLRSARETDLLDKQLDADRKEMEQARA